MAETLTLEVVTPDRRVVQEEVAEVTAPGILGEFGVLPGHVAFLTQVKPGVLTYRRSAGATPVVLAVSEGFVEVAQDKVTLLVNSSEPAGEIDRARAEAARDRASEKLKALSPEDQASADVQAALYRAEARLAASAKELH